MSIFSQKPKVVASGDGSGHLSVGGLWDHPHLSLSYARAARLLLISAKSETKDEEANLVPPMFFMVRHSAELALKDLLWKHHAAEVDLRRLQRAKRVPITAKPLLKARLKDIESTHDLSKLLQWVEEAMPEYVKRAWKSFVRKLIEIEGRFPDWSRYDSSRIWVKPSRIRKRHHRRRRNFKRPLLLPMESIITRLDAFLVEAAVCNFPGGKARSALEEIGLSSVATVHELYSRGLL